MRKEKTYLLTEIQDIVEETPSFLVVQYSKMDSAKSRDFRNQIASAEGEFEIVKKRVFAKAVEKYGMKIDPQEMKGHIGVIFAKDDQVASVAKAAYRYAKSNEDMLEFLCGRIEGDTCSSEDVKALATLPSIDELRAQIVGLLEAPLRNSIGVMQSLLTSVLYCLEQKQNQESSNN